MSAKDSKHEITEKYFLTRKIFFVFFLFIIIVVLYYISADNYLLFHSLAEMFSIIIAFGVFIVAWGSRKFSENYFLLFIAIASGFIGFIDSIHLFAYKGMGVFPGMDANLATQLWIAARYLQSISFLTAILFLKRKFSVKSVFVFYFALISVLLLSIFYWKIFPDCFIEGQGLTTFKKISEYVISVIILVFIFALFSIRKQIERNLSNWLIIVGVCTIISELAFTFYINVFGFSNFVGHILKIIAFYALYKAVILTSLQKPYSVLFNNMEKRSLEIAETNKRLKAEIKKRQEIEKRALKRLENIEKINKYLIGRELKMLELKKEIMMLKNNKKAKI